MKRSVVAVFLAAAVLSPVAAEAQMVILVRHAERADGGAAGQPMTGQSTPNNPDPELSDAGKARAARLATMLADSGIVAIYTTEYRRTKDTAAPLAAQLKLTPQVLGSRDQAALVAGIKSHTSGAVLVVGHSNSVPAIIKALGGPDVTIADAEYDNLFFLGPGGALTRIRFTP